MSVAKGKIGKLFSIMLSMIIMMNISYMAFAETSVAGTTVDMTTTINITNDVIAPPETTMNFTITPGSAVPGSVGQLPISAGIGSPTVTSSVDFSTSDYVAGMGSVAKTATKNITVDFSSVTFTKVGIYRYVVTQTPSSVITGMGYANSRYIDVYVTTDGTDLSATYVISDTVTSSKGNDFENTYPIVPTSLTVTNRIAGNQRELDREFNYTLSVTSLNTVTVTKTFLDSSTSVISEVSTGEYEFTLKGDEYITIDGLTDGNTYRVVQESEIVNGYTTTYKIGSSSAVDGLDTGVITVDGSAESVVFTNTRDAGTPTGVQTTYTPYMTMVFVSCGFLMIALIKRKKEEEYEG